MQTPLFIIGNKRSGSTLLKTLLNFHPEIFISHESDIVWLLYCQFVEGEITEYAKDSSKGMHRSLAIAKGELNSSQLPNIVFINYLKALYRHYNLAKSANDFDKLKYVGDQKPYQNADPLLFDFIEKKLTNARFIHLVRHPYKVASSISKFAQRKKGGDQWKGLSYNEILNLWTYHEKNALEVEKKVGERCFRLHYNELQSKPLAALKSLFEWLQLDFPKPTKSSILSEVKSIPKAFKNLNPNLETLEIMKEYGFKPKFGRYSTTIAPFLFKLTKHL